MCGIAALVTRSPPPDGRVVDRMVAALRHRGPDRQSSWHAGRCTLGSARLGVVDLAGGHQPMPSAGGRTAVAFNGAIHGFRALRQALAGYPFRTETDTELILALYERHGDDFLAHLPGMFGFALWDAQRQRLTVARDRFGEKPVYYATGADGSLLVASEIKSLLASGLVQPVLSRPALSQYLSKLHVHATQSIYANIQVLPPAHVLQWQDGRVTLRRYWEPPPAAADMDMAEAVPRFQSLLDQAVRRQLVADVPVGVLLSGGVDSTTIAAVASRHHTGLKSFSFGFEAGVESELPFARASAARYGLAHHERLDTGIDVPALLRRMQHVYDEPFGDSSSIPTFLLCELARQHVTVALGGDGADELLGGYMVWARHLALPVGRRPAAPAGPALALMRRLARRCRSRLCGQADRGSALVQRYATDCRIIFPPEDQRAMGLEPSDRHLRDCARYPHGSIDDLLRYDAEHYLPGDVLVKTDRASMAHGLELRAPFLDLDLASFCLSVPDHLKVDAHQEKLLLRQAYQQDWTDAVRQRSKQGFGGPMAVWLQQPAMQALKHDLLGNRAHPVYDLLDPASVQPFLAQDNQQTWSLLVLALWLEEHRWSTSAA